MSSMVESSASSYGPIKAAYSYLEQAPEKDKQLLRAVLHDAKIYHIIGEEEKRDECLRQFRQALTKSKLER